MCLFDLFKNNYIASAKVTNGCLVLSLPDAVTPVVWMLNLSDAATSVLRLESDDHGLFVIKKYSGKTSETVAVYRNRKPALRALVRATKALEKSRNVFGKGEHGQPVIVRPASKIGRAFTVFLFAWFILYLSGLDQYVLRWALTPFFSNKITTAQQAAMPAPNELRIPKTTEQDPANPNAVGVPLSADDYLGAQQNKPSMMR